MPTPEPHFQNAHIKQHFSRAASSYVAAAALQKEVESRLLEHAEYVQTPPQRVLDIGSGPGFAAKALKTRWPKADTIALDIALPMLALVAQQSRFWRPIKRVCGNAMQLPFQDHSFDFIFSNLCLQWAYPLPEALREIRRVLRPGGMLVFSTFGPSTLTELREAYLAIGEVPAISTFAAMQQIGDGMHACGLHKNVLERDIYTMIYPDLRGLMKELHAIGATDARTHRPRGLMGKQRWQRLNAAYPLIDGRLQSSWEVITAMAFKPAGTTRTDDGTVAVISPDKITRRSR
jgi:malonyl-CoA O-methyltransferase